MSWEKADEKLKKKINSEFVSYEIDWEFEYMQKVLEEELPQLNKDEINGAILDCCGRITPPRDRAIFMDYLRRRLNV